MTTDSSQATSQTPSQPAIPVQDAAVATPVAAVTSESAATATKIETPPVTAVTPEVKPEIKAPATADTKPAVAAPVIPDTYAFPEVKGPDGKAMVLDAEILPVMAPLFKAAGLTQDSVNGLVKSFVEYQAALPTKMLARDLETTMKDPDLGQLNWGRTQGMINEALGAFTTPKFRSKLERWGIANDLEFVRVFASIGKAMRGDSPAKGSPSTAEATSMADRLYSRATKIGQT